MRRTFPTAAPSNTSGAKITTEEMAGMLRIVPQTARSGLCRNGHYLGMRPVKLPNGKLLWDTIEVERLISGKAAI